MSMTLRTTKAVMTLGNLCGSQNEVCCLPQNRDRTGAANIGTQFCQLYENKDPIRKMTTEDLEFHRLNVGLCGECCD